MKQLYSAVYLIVFFCSAGIVLAQGLSDPINNTRYLALGDSVAFGYNPTVPVSLDNYHGYPEFTSDGVHRRVANASCFGESSGSFITAGAPDLGCQAWKAAGNPLFVTYSGTQLDYAVRYLSGNPNPVLVTINIGGNDLGLLVQSCQGDLNCELDGLPAVLAAYGQNLFTIFSRIRIEAKYHGPIVLLTYYVSNYQDPVEVGAFTELNGIASGIASAFGATIADGFKAFQVATLSFNGDSCAAGLLVKFPDGTCDLHPSLAGQKLLANAVLQVTNINDSEAGDN